jgi:hypothetical protein
MAPAMKKIVKLRIKVPANVTVVTELVKAPAELAIVSPKGTDLTPATMDMDLTSTKTSQWLSLGRRTTTLECVACCVRG